MRDRLYPFAGAAAVFAVDRASKLWVEATVGAWDIIPVIPGFFNIIHTRNTGMAFSLLSDAPEWVRLAVLVGVAGVVLCLVGVMLWQAVGLRQKVALALVFGGASGNLCDRLVRGSVTDFIDWYAGTFHWATFNIADAAITTGACLIALELFRKPAAATTCSPG